MLVINTHPFQIYSKRLVPGMISDCFPCCLTNHSVIQLQHSTHLRCTHTDIQESSPVKWLKKKSTTQSDTSHQKEAIHDVQDTFNFIANLIVQLKLIYKLTQTHTHINSCTQTHTQKIHTQTHMFTNSHTHMHKLTGELICFQCTLAADAATAAVQAFPTAHEGASLAGTVARQHYRATTATTRNHLQQSHTA